METATLEALARSSLLLDRQQGPPFYGRKRSPSRGCPSLLRWWPRLGYTQLDRETIAFAAGGSGFAFSSGGRWSRMQEVDQIENLKPEWICKPGTDDQIQNDTDQKDCDNCIDNLFEEVQKVGAVCTEQAKIKSNADTIIKLWKNGFTVNDGDLRSYTDVANQHFLDSIKKGELPLELQKIYDKEEVEVTVDDKKGEVYSLQKPIFHPFSGPGYRLGSATPRIISKVKKAVEEIGGKKPTVELNYLEPVTSIQIWLADGTRIVQDFNVSHRISHIRDFIINYQGHQERRPFLLTTSFPFRELLNESLTLEEANLKNVVIVQRLKNNIEPFRSFSS